MIQLYIKAAFLTQECCSEINVHHTYAFASSIDICSKEHPFVSGINTTTNTRAARLIIAYIKHTHGRPMRSKKDKRNQLQMYFVCFALAYGELLLSICIKMHVFSNTQGSIQGNSNHKFKIFPASESFMFLNHPSFLW